VEKKISLSSIIMALLIINAVGFILRYFELDTYFILFGFRFQLSLFLPLIIIFRGTQKKLVKNIFAKPGYKKSFFFVCLILIPVLIEIVSLFIFKKIKIENPDYFYEFGLSSIIDYPIYLIWNSPQLIFFILFLIICSSVFKFKAIGISILILFLFAYQLTPLKKESPDYFQLASFISISFVAGILIKRFQNIYWLVVFFFSIFWINTLLFGSNSKMVINLLFASQYNSWEGFFSIAKGFGNYLLPVQFLIVLLIALPAGLRTNTKIKSGL
jgi:hypothetical protein